MHFFEAHGYTSPDKRASMHSVIVWFLIETVKQAVLFYWSIKILLTYPGPLKAYDVLSSLFSS